MNQKTDNFKSSEITRLLLRPIHYTQFLAVMLRMDMIPEDELAMIRRKPKQRKWYDLCKKYSLDTAPLSLTLDRKKYRATHHLTERVAELTARNLELEYQLKQQQDH